MITSVMPSVTPFTPSEREYIRRELDQFFGTLPTVAEGFQLRTWRGCPQKGQPKLPPPAKDLINRGFMRLDTSRSIPRLFFTETGMMALRQMIWRSFSTGLITTDEDQTPHAGRQQGVGMARCRSTSFATTSDCIGDSRAGRRSCKFTSLLPRDANLTRRSRGVLDPSNERRSGQFRASTYLNYQALLVPHLSGPYARSTIRNLCVGTQLGLSWRDASNSVLAFSSRPGKNWATPSPMRGFAEPATGLRRNDFAKCSIASSG
jgi:hypothetical protein